MSKNKRKKPDIYTSALSGLLVLLLLLPLLSFITSFGDFGGSTDNSIITSPDSPSGDGGIDSSGVSSNTPGSNHGTSHLSPQPTVLDTSGFVDYTFPVQRNSTYNLNEHGLKSSQLYGGASVTEIVEENGNKYLEFGTELKTEYADNDSYVDFLPSGKVYTTQEYNGVVVSFDIAMDRTRALERFLLVLRDDNGPKGSTIPYDVIQIPNIYGVWQRIVLNYNFRENTCDVYINGVKTSYTDVFKNYDSTATYRISVFRCMYSVTDKTSRTFLDNVNMDYYTEFDESTLDSGENLEYRILNSPIAYVDGVAYMNFNALEEALTGNTQKDVVVVSPYLFNNSGQLKISCPVRIKNYSPMELVFATGLELIGEKDGIAFYDFKQTN